MKKHLLLFLGMMLIALVPQVANATTYTIAGNNALLWGTTWEPTNTANDMTAQADGIYKWTSAEITAEQNLGLEFKVCEDYGWDKSYGNNGGNFNYTLKAGSGKVSITFDPATQAIAVLTDEWTESNEVKPVTYNVYIGTAANATAGITTAWGQGDDTKFTASEDNKTFTYELKNPGAAMEFKIITNDGGTTKWWECNGFALGTEGTLTSNNGGNISLPANDGYDSYTFTVTRNDDGSEWKLTVVANGTASNKSSLFLGSAGYEWKQTEDNTFGANDEGTEYTLSIANPGAELSFKVVVDGVWMTVADTATTLELNTPYTISKVDGMDNNMILPQLDGDAPIVFTVTKADDTWTLTVASTNTVTAISTLPAAARAVSSALYNLAGQRVSKNYRGLVIRNGRKYVNK